MVLGSRPSGSGLNQGKTLSTSAPPPPSVLHYRQCEEHDGLGVFRLARKISGCWQRRLSNLLRMESYTFTMCEKKQKTVEASLSGFYLFVVHMFWSSNLFGPLLSRVQLFDLCSQRISFLSFIDNSPYNDEAY